MLLRFRGGKSHFSESVVKFTHFPTSKDAFLLKQCGVFLKKKVSEAVVIWLGVMLNPPFLGPLPLAVNKD